MGGFENPKGSLVVPVGAAAPEDPNTKGLGVVDSAAAGLFSGMLVNAVPPNDTTGGFDSAGAAAAAGAAGAAPKVNEGVDFEASDGVAFQLKAAVFEGAG